MDEECFALCSFVRTRSAEPRLVALLPQQELRDSYSNQVCGLQSCVLLERNAWVCCAPIYCDASSNIADSPDVSQVGSTISVVLPSPHLILGAMPDLPCFGRSVTTFLINGVSPFAGHRLKVHRHNSYMFNLPPLSKAFMLASGQSSQLTPSQPLCRSSHRD